MSNSSINEKQLSNDGNLNDSEDDTITLTKIVDTKNSVGDPNPSAFTIKLFKKIVTSYFCLYLMLPDSILQKCLCKSAKIFQCVLVRQCRRGQDKGGGAGARLSRAWC